MTRSCSSCSKNSMEEEVGTTIIWAEPRRQGANMVRLFFVTPPYCSVYGVVPTDFVQHSLCPSFADANWPMILCSAFHYISLSQSNDHCFINALAKAKKYASWQVWGTTEHR